MLPSESPVFGRRIPRVDARDKALGRAEYASDLHLPGMLVARALYAPVASGIVRRLDVSEARRTPGVHAVITYEDIPGEPMMGKIVYDQPILVKDRIRSRTDVLCVVAAETQQAAKAALACVRVEYDKLPGVFTVEEALQPGSPQVHEGGNLLKHWQIRHGDVERGLAEADVIVEDTYRTQLIDHAYIGPEAAFAVPDEEGHLTVWLETHHIFEEREQIVRALGLDRSQVRTVLATVGGSFGGKDDGRIGIWVSLLAWLTGRPVRMVYPRAESFVGHYKRHPQVIHARTGARADGRLTAAEVDIYADTGAYAHFGPSIIGFNAVQATGPYRVPNARVDAYVVYTNNLVGGPMRGWGTPQVCFAWESQMDQLAARLGMHPLVFRYINAVREGDTSITGATLPTGVGLRATIRKAAELMGVELPE